MSCYPEFARLLNRELYPQDWSTSWPAQRVGVTPGTVVCWLALRGLAQRGNGPKEVAHAGAARSPAELDARMACWADLNQRDIVAELLRVTDAWGWAQ